MRYFTSSLFFALLLYLKFTLRFRDLFSSSCDMTDLMKEKSKTKILHRNSRGLQNARACGGVKSSLCYLSGSVELPTIRTTSFLQPTRRSQTISFLSLLCFFPVRTVAPVWTGRGKFRWQLLGLNASTLVRVSRTRAYIEWVGNAAELKDNFRFVIIRVFSVRFDSVYCYLEAIFIEKINEWRNRRKIWRAQRNMFRASCSKWQTLEVWKESLRKEMTRAGN